jgi:hypothetical protein
LEIYHWAVSKSKIFYKFFPEVLFILLIQSDCSLARQYESTIVTQANRRQYAWLAVNFICIEDFRAGDQLLELIKLKRYRTDTSRNIEFELNWDATEQTRHET